MNIALYAFRKYGDMVLRAAYHHVRSYSEAEDITQEVFLKLHAEPQSFSSDEHLKAWLLRSAINRCINYHKSFRIRNRQSLDEVNEESLSYEFTSDDKTVLEKVSALPDKYSSVIYLYYYEEYSIREISEILGKNENTVSSLLRRARKRLKLELEEDEVYEKQGV
ncbi:MAG: sigma-70 family RNA polymerase sigma factor [Ruminococcus sp.]|nr:sigma-70 family RNA polymerase sigma factor [Ruminococcus sp.]